MKKPNPILDDAPEEVESKSDPLHECRERFKLAMEYWDDDRKAALDDIKFRGGDQWPDDIASQREKDKRPCLTVDKLSQYVRQIVNDGRQNRPSIKVRPVDSGSDLATAEIYAGIIKHIEESSGADAAYDTALDSSATCGFGFFTVDTEYSGEETFDQNIMIKRVRNPLSVVIDPGVQRADSSDMKFAFVLDTMEKDVFKEKYPGKMPTDWETNEDYGDWYGDKVRIARYWYVVEEDRTLYQMQDGTVISKARLDEFKDIGIEVDSLIKQERNIPIRKVMHALVSGKEYLEEPAEWIGKHIPVCVVWGNEIDIEGKVTHSGIIRPAKDPQRLYNYSRTAFAERVALTPKAPWLAAEGQVEDYPEWETANTEPHSVLRYRPTSLGGQPVAPPSRISPSDIPAGFQQDMQISEHDIQGAIGMYAASLGAPSNERSGKAIMARQKEGDTGTFHYHDNLNRAIRHCGRILVDLIPKVYDTNRVVRIMGYDGAVSDANLSADIPTASQKQGMKMMYNLGVGTYDVSITSGPSYNTLRMEATESMVEMVQANPDLMSVIGDLMVKNMDWPGAEEISKRLHSMLPPPILQAEQEAKQNQMSPEMQQMKQQTDMALQQMDAQMQELQAAFQECQQKLQVAESAVKNKDGDIAVKMEEVKVKHAELEIAAAELELKQQEISVKQFEAETKRMEAEAAAHDAEGRLALDAYSAEVAANTPAPEAAAAAPAAPQQEQQPINITIDGQRPVQKTARATRQPDGSYVMESIESPVND